MTKPIDRDALAHRVAFCFAKPGSLPDWMQMVALGRDMTPLGEMAADAIIEYLSTADSTDRDALARVIADALVEGGWAGTTDDGLRAFRDAVEPHLRATGPARDEGLRAVLEALCDEARDGGGHDAVVVSVASIRAALAASPAPGGDTAPREDGLLALLDDLPRVLTAERGRRGIGLREAAAEMGVPYDSLWRIENGRGVSSKTVVTAVRWLLAARPVPPGPAATRDGETGDR